MNGAGHAVKTVGSAIGEWNYFILASLIEAALLAGVVYYAWTWPKASGAVVAPAEPYRAGTRVHS